jgi:hypothetical protein
MVLVRGGTGASHDEPRGASRRWLIRPGRVDMKLEFWYTNQDINGRLFCAVFMREDFLPDGSRRGDEGTLFDVALCISGWFNKGV